MKTIGSIFLILFTVITIYLTKNDVFSFLKKMVLYPTTTIVKQEQPVINETSLNVKNGISLPERQVITPGPLNKAEQAVNPNRQYLSANEIITFTNEARTKNGLNLNLVNNPKLNNSAQIKLDDMIKNNYFEHISPSGVSISDLSKKVGYDYIVIGENLALGDFANAQDIVNAWMASPGHRANILNKKYKDIGVAVAYTKILGRNAWLAVQHFGISTDFCPKVDIQLKNEINANQSILVDKSNELSVLKEAIDNIDIYQKDYENKINNYNNAIKIYNELANKTKEMIALYNNEVADFNLCITNQGE